MCNHDWQYTREGAQETSNGVETVRWVAECQLCGKIVDVSPEMYSKLEKRFNREKGSLFE